MRPFLFPFLLLFGFVSCENQLRSRLNAERASEGNQASVESAAFAAVSTPYANLFMKYERLREALSKDQLTAVGKLAKDLAGETTQLLTRPNEKSRDLLSNLNKVSFQLTQKKDDDEIRKGFGEVSRATVVLYKKSNAKFFDYYFCPMAKDYHYWLQTKDTKIANPYMGTKMSQCGSKENLN